MTHQSRLTLSSLSEEDYSSPSIYSCESAQSLTSYWANYQVPIPGHNSFYAPCDIESSNSLNIPLSVSFSSISALIAEIQREAGFLFGSPFGKRKSLGKYKPRVQFTHPNVPQDGTPQTSVDQRDGFIPKNNVRKLSSSRSFINDIEQKDNYPTKQKIETSLSLSTEILDFPYNSNTPASCRLETYDNASRLPDLVSALPSSQALGNTVPYSMSEIIQSGLPSQQSLAELETLVSLPPRPPSPVPPSPAAPSNHLRQSTMLNFVRKAKSTLKLITSRSLRNLSKLKTKSNPGIRQSPDTMPLPLIQANATLPRALPLIPSVTSKTYRFSSWFSTPEADSPLRQFDSPLPLTSSPSYAESEVSVQTDVCLQLGKHGDSETSPSEASCGGEVGHRVTDQTTGLDSANFIRSETIFRRDEAISHEPRASTSLDALVVDSSQPMYRTRPDAQTLRGYRRERIAAAQSYHTLEKDFELYSSASLQNRGVGETFNVEANVHERGEDMANNHLHTEWVFPSSFSGDTPKAEVITTLDGCDLAVSRGCTSISSPATIKEEDLSQLFSCPPGPASESAVNTMTTTPTLVDSCSIQEDRILVESIIMSKDSFVKRKSRAVYRKLKIGSRTRLSLENSSASVPLQPRIILTVASDSDFGSGTDLHGNLNEKENDPGTFRSSSQRLMHARDVVVGRGLPSRQKKSNPKANKVILHADSQRKNVTSKRHPLHIFIYPRKKALKALPECSNV